MQHQRYAKIRRGCGWIIILAKVTGQLQISKGTIEEGLALGCILGSDAGCSCRIVLVGLVDEDVVVTDGRIFSGPVAGYIVIAVGEALVGSVHRTIVVAIIDRGVETIAHHLVDHRVVAVEGRAE